MEAIFQLVALIFGFLVWLMFCTVHGVCQAIAGVLYPTQNHIMARYQRIALALLIPALVLLFIGASAMLILQWHAVALWSILPGIIAALVGGFFGRLAEAEFKRCDQLNKAWHPTATTSSVMDSQSRGG